MHIEVGRRFAVLVGVALGLALPALATAADNPIEELVPGTAVLLNQPGGGGNGGGTSSPTSSTNIFSPSAYVDYKRLRGEPTVVVDRHPFRPGPDRGIAYYSAPLGVGFPR